MVKKRVKKGETKEYLKVCYKSMKCASTTMNVPTDVNQASSKASTQQVFAGHTIYITPDNTPENLNSLDRCQP